jgi:hypothetical protein
LKRRPSIFGDTFWGNPEITLASRLFQVGILILIPAGYFVGEYLVRRESCASDSKLLYAAWIAVLAAHSAYFCLFDRPKVLRAFAQMLVSKKIEIRRNRTSYGIWSDDVQHGALSVVTLALLTLVYVIVIVFWCFWDSILERTCAGQLRGNPGVALVTLGTSFALVVMHEFLLWAYGTMAVWKVKK